MKKLQFILIIILLIPTVSFADMGTCYCMKSEIKTKDGKVVSGYFSLSGYNLYIGLDNNKFHYYSERVQKKLNFSDSITNPLQLQLTTENKEFFHYIKSILIDTVKIYSDNIEIRFKETSYNKYIIPYLLGTEIKISREQIESIQILSITECGVGMRLSTNLTINDKEWIRESKLTKNMGVGGIELCSYRLLQYEQPTNESLLMIEDLQELLLTGQLHAQNYHAFTYEVKQIVIDKIQSLIQELKRYKIIMVQSCSC